MGLLTKEDSEIFRGCFKEMAKLRGIHVLYKYPIDKSRTIHSELVVAKYSDTIETDVIFDTSPKLATLRRLGWVSETQDDKPYIIQVAYDLPELQYGCIITLPTPAGMSGKDFRVTDIQFIMEFPDSWYCKVVPIFERDEDKVNNSYTNGNYNYIKK